MFIKKHPDDGDTAILFYGAREFAFAKVAEAIHGIENLQISLRKDLLFEMKPMLQSRPDGFEPVVLGMARLLYGFELLGIVHGDIKMDNVVYSQKTKRTIVIDYGLSQVIQSPLDKGFYEDNGIVAKLYPPAYRVLDEEKQLVQNIDTENELFAFMQTIKKYSKAQYVILDTLTPKSFADVLRVFGAQDHVFSIREKVADIIRESMFSEDLIPDLETVLAVPDIIKPESVYGLTLLSKFTIEYLFLNVPEISKVLWSMIRKPSNLDTDRQMTERLFIRGIVEILVEQGAYISDHCIIQYSIGINIKRYIQITAELMRRFGPQVIVIGACISRHMREFPDDSRYGNIDQK